MYLVVLLPQTLPDVLVDHPLQLLHVAEQVRDGEELCGVLDVVGCAQRRVDVSRVDELDDLGQRLGREHAAVARQDRLQAARHAAVGTQTLALKGKRNESLTRT